jgi:hypothetical protein
MKPNKTRLGVIPPPEWLVKEMERQRNLPPPTSEEAETQFRAAEAMRANYDSNLPAFNNGRSKPVR